MKLFVSDNIQFNDLRQVLKVLVKVKAMEKNIKLSEAYLNLVLDFHFYGTSKDTYQLHIDKSIKDKAHFKSIATIDNAKSYLKKVGVMDSSTTISPDFLPAISLEDACYLNLKIFYDKENE